MSVPAGLSEAELRDQRYSVARPMLRATGHTASDQVETILYRLASRGSATGIEVRRADGVVRPLLSVWREETAECWQSPSLPSLQAKLSSSVRISGAHRRHRKESDSKSSN